MSNKNIVQTPPTPPPAKRAHSILSFLNNIVYTSTESHRKGSNIFQKLYVYILPKTAFVFDQIHNLFQVRTPALVFR